MLRVSREILSYHSALSLAIKAEVDNVSGRVEEVTKLLEGLKLNTTS